MALACVFAPIASAVTLTAEIHQVAPGQVVAVDLIAMHSSGRAPGKVVQTVALETSEQFDRVVRCKDIEPGRYTVVVRGAKPWQRAGERIDVFDFEMAPLHVQLAPFDVQITAPAKANVVLRHHEACDRAAAEDDADRRRFARTCSADRRRARVSQRP